MSVRELSVAEAQSRRSSDVVVHEKAVRQSAATLVNIPGRGYRSVAAVTVEKPARTGN
jgi:hypothetical protein